MKTLTVALPGREYDIVIERGLLAQAGERVRAVLPKAQSWPSSPTVTRPPFTAAG